MPRRNRQTAISARSTGTGGTGEGTADGAGGGGVGGHLVPLKRPFRLVNVGSQKRKLDCNTYL